MVINKFKYENLQEAWEQLQEYIVNNENKVRGEKHQGFLYGTMLSLYDTIIMADSCKINPKFNFGRVLGYTDKKWSKLVKNYVNQDYLDLVRSEIQTKEKARNPHYVHVFHFDNLYGSGKDCLISLTITKRKNDPCPVLTYHTRASEITKRLIFDFLLIQRIAEYIYGDDRQCKVICHLVFCFVNLECFMMYLAWKGLDVLTKQDTDGYNRQEKPHYSKFQERCLTKYKYFQDTDLSLIKYQVHKRAAAQVQKDERGRPVSNVKTLYARDLKLFKSDRNIKIITQIESL